MSIVVKGSFPQNLREESTTRPVGKQTIKLSHGAFFYPPSKPWE